MIGLKRKCFHCRNKFKREDMYKLNMNTSDGVHSVFLCEQCTRQVLVDTKEYAEWTGKTKDESV